MEQLLTKGLYVLFHVVAADGNEPVQMKLHKSLRIWAFYVDLEESLGTLESTREVYERILDLRIATPQIIINYALLLEVCTNLLIFCHWFSTYLFPILVLMIWNSSGR